MEVHSVFPGVLSSFPWSFEAIRPKLSSVRPKQYYSTECAGFGQILVLLGPFSSFEVLDAFRTLRRPWGRLGMLVVAPIRASNLRSKCLSLVRNVKYLEISENTWNYLKTPWRQEQGKIMRKVCKNYFETRDSTLQWGDKCALKTSTSIWNWDINGSQVNPPSFTEVEVLKVDVVSLSFSTQTFCEKVDVIFSFSLSFWILHFYQEH